VPPRVGEIHEGQGHMAARAVRTFEAQFTRQRAWAGISRRLRDRQAHPPRTHQLDAAYTALPTWRLHRTPHYAILAELFANHQLRRPRAKNRGELHFAAFRCIWESDCAGPSMFAKCQAIVRGRRCLLSASSNDPAHHNKALLRNHTNAAFR
jgi:hypothetical protein